MPSPSLTRAQSRAVDEFAMHNYGIGGLVLMENAGRGVVDFLERSAISGPVVVCCGKGNNAGDGFVVTRHLNLRGHNVRTLLFADPGQLTGDAKVNYEILCNCGLDVDVLGEESSMEEWDRMTAAADWIVDALLGTGAQGAPRPPVDTAIRFVNAHRARKLAVDVPSGLDCDTGRADCDAVRADHTCTFVAPKAGFSVAGAEAYTGRVHVLDIGVPQTIVEEVVSGEW